MFKSCRNLFNLSRKLGSVVGGLGLAGVLFSGQVSAAPPRSPWSQEEKDALVNVVLGFVAASENRSKWSWKKVSEKLSNNYGIHKGYEVCRQMYTRIAANRPDLRAIYYPGNSDWSTTECLALLRIAEDYGTRNGYIIWGEVTNEYNNYIAEHNNSVEQSSDLPYYQERSPDACKRKYNTIRDLANVSSVRKRSLFTPEEDATIARLVQQSRESGMRQIPWRRIAQSVEKTVGQCEYRYKYYINMPPFTPAEDRQLMDLVARFGETSVDWKSIARQMGNGKKHTHCRRRYDQLAEIASLGKERDGQLTVTSRFDFLVDGIDIVLLGLNQDSEQNLDLAENPMDTALTDSSRANGESQTGNPFVAIYDSNEIDFFDIDLIGWNLCFNQNQDLTGNPIFDQDPDSPFQQ